VLAERNPFSVISITLAGNLGAFQNIVYRKIMGHSSECPVIGLELIEYASDPRNMFWEKIVGVFQLIHFKWLA
jgi:hypothetical protein